MKNDPLFLRKAAVEYIDSLRDPDSWTFRFCAANEPSLIGTSVAGMLAAFLGYAEALPPDKRQAWIQSIQACQRPDGWFEDYDISEANLRPGYGKDRALLHRTRHALLALQGLGATPLHRLTFVDEWIGRGKMTAWCRTLDLSDYWYASNMLMDAAIFLMSDADRTGSRRPLDAVRELLDFCDSRTSPSTGYHDADRSEIRNAMAGAMHLYPIYILMGRPIQHVTTIVDTTCALQQPDGLFGYESGSGGEDCLDYDAVLILANAYFLTGETGQSRIREVFARCRDAIMVNHNPDGGFACHRRDEPYYFGTRTTTVPAGKSSLWASYSRLMTIAMIDKVLNRPSADIWQLGHHVMEVWDGGTTSTS